MRVPAFAILISCLASAALADDFKTTEGKEYKNATVLCVEPDGIVIKTRAGISKLYFSELPPEVLERFHFGSQWSAQLPAGANQEIRITQQQNIEEDQECEDEAPRKVKIAQEKQLAILAKAESIRIPHIGFRDVTVREAIESLAAQGHDHDPGGTGVVIGMFMNDIESAFAVKAKEISKIFRKIPNCCDCDLDTEMSGIWIGNWDLQDGFTAAIELAQAELAIE